MPSDEDGTLTSSPRPTGDAGTTIERPASTARPGPQRGEAVPLPTVSPSYYARQAEIARGGMGRIVSAQDRRLDRPVAIKELLPGMRDASARFQREALLTAQLEHPSIVSVHEA